MRMQRESLWITLAGAWCAVLFGIAGMAGWWLGLVGSALTTLAGITPIRFNGALAIAIAGAAAFTLTRGRMNATRILASAAGLIAGATLLEYIAGIDLGIDAALVPANGSQLSPRMSLFAVSSILLIVIAIGLQTFAAKRIALRLGTFFAAIALSLNILGAIGYAGRIESAYTWGNTTSISVNALIALLALSFALIARGLWDSTRLLDGVPAWASWLVAFIVSTTSIGIYIAMRVMTTPSSASDLDEVVLGFGLALAVACAFVVHWFRTARIEARELEHLSASLRARDAELSVVTERLNVAIVGSEVGIWDWNLLTNEIYFSPRWKQMLGYEEHELSNALETWEALVEPSDLDAASAAFQAHFADPTKIYRVHFRMRHRDGGWRWIQARGSALRDANGKAWRFAGSHTDVTEVVHAREQLLVHAERLAQSNEELEQFAYVASHDLQEPLRMVASYTQLLSDRYGQQLDERARKYIHYAVDGAVRMQGLINDLLAFSRIGSRGKDAKPVDTNEAMSQVIANLRFVIERSGGRVNVEKLPVVMADGSQLVQLFQNLVVNALKFHGAEPPVVDVRCKRNGEWYEFSVSDNGIGIAPEYFESIFVAFQRLHGREEYEGNGIGLAVCKKIVNRQGGKIWLTSELGKGTTFYFTLPLATENDNSTKDADTYVLA
jgi:PAS domain S-box-containing protein